jgi:uncharacterized RDD family membrane protein YckC
MTCPVCGKTSSCVHVRSNASALLDHEVYAGNESGSAPTADASARAADDPSATELAWRQEVSSRVQQHRARRRRPMDPKALELDFSSDTPHSFGALASDRAMPPPPERFAEIIFRQGLAEREPARPEPKIIRFPRTQPAYVPTVEEVTLDELELADLLSDKSESEAPRILDVAEATTYEQRAYEPEVYEAQAYEAQVYETQAYEPGTFEPEGRVAAQFEREAFASRTAETYSAPPASLRGQQMDLLPSFADIRLEAEETRLANDLEIIPRPAPLMQRFVSGVVDAGIVLIASGIFVLTFAIAAEEMPQSRMTTVCMLAAAGIFWLVFQYIFLIFSHRTPGMNMAELELCTFAGGATSTLEQRNRALASTLSAAAMGLGFAWALVDEDRLGWHDRISRTHLRTASPCAIPSRAREPYYYDDLKG